MKKYKSDILKNIHEDAEGLHRIGVINDEEMKEFDKDCLVTSPESAYQTGRQNPIPAYASPNSN